MAKGGGVEWDREWEWKWQKERQISSLRRGDKQLNCVYAAWAALRAHANENENKNGNGNGRERGGGGC